MTGGRPWRWPRWRPTWTAGAALALVGLTAGMLVTVLQVRRGWEGRRASAERSLQDYLATAGLTLVEEVLASEAMQVRSLLWPVLGTVGRPGARPLTLDEVAAYADDQRAANALQVGRFVGYARVARDGVGAALRTESRGGLAGQPVLLRSIVAHPGIAGLLGGRGRVVAGQLPDAPGLPPLAIVAASERGAGGRPIAVFAIVYDRTTTVAENAEIAMRTVPLLPHTFHGAGWRTARADAPTARAPGDTLVPLRVTFDESPGAGPSPRDNVALAVRIRTRAGRPLFERAAAAPAVWSSPYAAALAFDGPDLDVEVALPAAHGRALVDAAVPIRRERRLLGAVLALGGLSALSAAFALRRQRELSRARDTFVAAVSHELRTPLAHISLLSDTLRAGGAESPEQADRWLGAINREAHRLGDLVQNVLLFARGQRRPLAASRAPTDLVALAHDTIDTLAGAHGRPPQVEVHAAGPVRASVDAASMRHVLLNLLDNAVKYGPPEQRVRVTLARDGDRVRVTVDDEGPGVPRRDRARVWRPFVRLAEGGPHGGSGLGLAVVRQVVRAHGGTVAVNDAPGGGARFVVTLPAGAADR